MKNYLNCRSTGARALLTLLLFAAIGCLLVKAASFDVDATDTASQRTLAFADRVAYQRAVEEVYWRHRIWPQENPRPKPSLDEVMSDQQVQQKVQEYKRNSQLLADQWHRPITPEQLQAEINRMASHTRQPEVLRELFAALGNDPFIIAECLARTVLSERLVRELQVRSNAPSESNSEQSRAAKTDTPSVTTDQFSCRYYLPEITSSPIEDPTGGCADSWKATSTSDASTGRFNHTAVWTGTEMIIWGGEANGRLNTGGRYNPSTDSWAATSTIGAPDPRGEHTAVWTGTEMIVWGGTIQCCFVYANTGGRYNPSTDSWVATSTTNAPDARRGHTAVWTGSEMIVWGGTNQCCYFYVNTGGRYNPSTDSWVATSKTSAPDARDFHTAVWTGSEMIVWGGNFSSNRLNTGGRYNPSTNSWVVITTNGAPGPRGVHTAVWTGTEMIVWGGFDGRFDVNTGGRYNPITDSWVATSMHGVPTVRSYHTAIWTGTEMIVWGGINGDRLVHTGARYNPSTDSWFAATIAGAPDKRLGHTAVWTGSEMIVWGGRGNGQISLNTGGRYVPCAENWAPTTTTGAPSTRHYHTAVWTGAEMIVWGGNLPFLNTGGRYTPSTDSWIATTTVGAPKGRANHTAVWSGTEMIIWGGISNSGLVGTGGRYSPVTDSWVATTTNGAPVKRWFHTAVWSGTEMIVWGGDAPNGQTKSGGRYNPGTDSWLPTKRSRAPVARQYHTAVWSGTEMIVWGGYDHDTNSLNTGGKYNPSTDSWVATTITGAPDQRYWHTAVWTGTEMIVWGGASESAIFNDGGRYNPSTDSWVATTISGAPDSRAYLAAVWTGTEMIVWGGTYDFLGTCFNTGGRYNPSTDNWVATTTTGAPDGRHLHTAVWTGTEMIVWGGDCTGNGDLNTGGRYSP